MRGLKDNGSQDKDIRAAWERLWTLGRDEREKTCHRIFSASWDAINKRATWFLGLKTPCRKTDKAALADFLRGVKVTRL